ncbi:MAG: T9SS type A sorting domain-containing protein [Saprospiraceae bacterium]|jgi:hypothetical protein|nr:T9SS type A sorting domain-containing protein [Candidatus Brachybacter algidus]MBK9024487.1 T9SS type A sorting domain-containing protein [Candidatus Brachybacter algidus]HQX44705.1 T9SS type A sorting domain-containing protein [Saprospiraceae bacterium]
MKTFYIFFFFVLTSLTLHAQVEFPKLNASWCYRAYGDHGENLYNFCVGPDSIINVAGIEYSRVSFKNILNPQFDTIYYREEDRKLYILPEDSTNEMLLCDFNLIVGDSFTAPAWGFWAPQTAVMTVYDVYYMTTNDGVERKVMQLGSNNGEGFNATWIEGIGDISWIFLFPNYVGSISGGYNFICHSIDGKLIYGEENYCNSLISTKAEISRKSISLYPNPTNEKFTFSDLNNFKQIKIYNVWGQEHSYKMRNQEIDISHLKAGIYIVVITDQNNNQYFSKIVKL